MNEFNAQTGGRYVYVDDVLNLQDLALAFGHIFDECDNFIISGCEVSGSAISAGYVYLNGKVRRFSGATGITAWPQYLYEKNSTESVNYASGNAKVGRNIYSVSIGSSIPTTADALTGKVPVAITINSNGGTQMKDAFLGKYALLLTPANLSQVLNGSLKINGDLEITGNTKSLQNHFQIVGSQATFDAFFDSGDLNLQTKYTAGDTYSLYMKNGVGAGIKINNTVVAQVNTDGLICPGYIQSSLGIIGGTGISPNGVYNSTDATDTGTLNINMVGYDNGTQFYRNTVIGNGKGAAIVSVDGREQTVNISGATTIASGTASESLVFALNKAKTNTDLQSMVTWKDSEKVVMGVLGYTESTDASFRITNNLAGVYVYGAANSFVDLGPMIKENGRLLTDKYLQITDFNTTIATVAKVVDVYNKTQSDARYSKLSDGFNGYISETNTQEVLRGQIGAIGAEDLNAYTKKELYLSDMATTATEKKKIRDNIGAAGVDEYQPKLKDSGWQQLTSAGLYIRQIGNIVSIEGMTSVPHEGIVFVIPNTIDPPTHDVFQAYTRGGTSVWEIYIEAGSRECKVNLYIANVEGPMRFLMTYMV